MSEVWPLDVRTAFSRAAVDRLRPFNCLLLMPFEHRFNVVADEIKSCIDEVYASAPQVLGQSVPEIDRLDWVTSSGVIQNEIWDKLVGSDLVFCDITGYNPNVMFESGVASGWKKMHQVVFIRDHYFKQQSPFDIAPIRYTEYELTSDGLPSFRKKIMNLVRDAFIAFPDSLVDPSPPCFPAQIDFADDYDDRRIYTPPLAHRRILNSALEFGSTLFFPESWASLGNARVSYFDLEFDGAFRNPVKPEAWIGVGVRSQHFFANYAHILYLKRDGAIILTEPDESKPNSYWDRPLREPTKIDDSAFHYFHVRFDAKNFFVAIDDFSESFEVAKLPKVYGPGLIRFQSSHSWMAISGIRASEI